METQLIARTRPSPARNKKQAMHEGVVRDLEQQRLKRERQEDFDLQRALEAEYRRGQNVVASPLPPPPSTASETGAAGSGAGAGVRQQDRSKG